MFPLERTDPTHLKCSNERLELEFKLVYFTAEEQTIIMIFFKEFKYIIMAKSNTVTYAKAQKHTNAA